MFPLYFAPYWIQSINRKCICYVFVSLSLTETLTTYQFDITIFASLYTVSGDDYK